MQIDYSGFIVAILPIALSPGAGFTLAVNSALAEGWRGVATIILGTALGIYCHALLVGLGVSSMLMAFPSLFHILQIAGTVYLLWLGSQLIFSGLRACQQAVSPVPQPVTLSQALLANLLNPKAVLLYLTVVSRFTGQSGNLRDFMLLASVHIVIMAGWLSGASQLLMTSTRTISTVTLRKYINTLGGIVLLAIALSGLIP